MIIKYLLMAFVLFKHRPILSSRLFSQRELYFEEVTNKSDILILDINMPKDG
jgi:hypothetical protein